MEKSLNEALYNFALCLLTEADASKDWHEAQKNGGQHVARNPNMHWLQAKHIIRLAEDCGVPKRVWLGEGWQFQGVAEEIDYSVRGDVIEGELL